MSRRHQISGSAGGRYRKTIDKHQKIAIVGAGISGLTIARALRQRGYTHVVVFEKSFDVGGKIQSMSWNGQVYETGALVANHNFKQVMATAYDLGETLTKAQDAFLLEMDGKITSYHQFVKKHFGWKTFLISAAKLFAVARHGSELRKPGLAQIDRAFYAPMSEFAETHHFKCAAQMVQPFLIGCGYGYYEHIPAMYLMKLAPWVLGQPFLDSLTLGHSRAWSTFDHGWQHVVRRMSEGIDLRLGTEVTSIQRESEKEKGGVDITAGGQTEVFDRLILTAQPQAFLGFLDVSKEETRLFQAVKYIRYVVTLVAGVNLVTAHFLPHIAPQTIGHVNCIVRQHANTNIYHLYQMLPEHMTLHEALDIAQLDVNLIGGSIINVITQREWPYFPHVCTADLEQGFYQDLERMQGDRHTYYAGSLLNFDTVEHNAAYAEDLVERFF